MLVQIKTADFQSDPTEYIDESKVMTDTYQKFSDTSGIEETVSLLECKTLGGVLSRIDHEKFVVTKAQTRHHPDVTWAIKIYDYYIE